MFYVLCCFLVPSQQAALQQVSLMKRELTELRTELSLREQDMYKDETELQTEVCTIIMIDDRD